MHVFSTCAKSKRVLQVYLAQARCLSSLGRLKDAIGIVRACVVSFEQSGINNSLSRQFRVEFGSMLIDVGSFSEASEFFEKVALSRLLLKHFISHTPTRAEAIL